MVLRSKMTNENTLILFLHDAIIAEVAERSPIVYKIVVNDQAEKIWTYDRSTIRPTKMLLLTCVVNCTAGTPTPRLCSVV